jgi:trimeric autotransporter adhesin
MQPRFSILIPVFILFSLFSSLDLSAQSPPMISYQGIIRDDGGASIPETDIVMKFSILQGSTSGPTVYWEIQTAHTNSFGLVNLKIGSVRTGIETIDWSAGPYFLKVEADTKVMGTTQLLSIPYALYALKAGNGFSGIYNDLTGKPDLSVYLQTETDPVFNVSPAKTITNGDLTNWNTSKWIRAGDSLYYLQGNVGIGTKDPRSTLSVSGTTPNDSAIFEVKNNNGLTVFAVYNDGVRITIDERAKGATKGGFAIGGFGTVKGVSRDYMKITKDSIRMYLDNTAPAKGATKGGFAIGGFDAAKAPNARYMNISTDGGTAAGFNTFLGYKAGGPGSGGLYNIAVGSYSGYNLNLATSLTGRNNIFIGDSAGLSNSVGYQNVYIGKNSGSKNTSGYSNIYVGYRSGSLGTSGQYNVFVGDQTGKSTTGSLNVFIGTWAGQSVTSGQENTLIGTNSGWKLGTGQDNTFLGTHTGTSSVNKNGNTFIGAFAGGDNISGSNNVFLGKWAGRQSLGSNNIFIGNEAGYSVTTGDDQLIIDNNPTNVSTAFIGGDMLNEKLIINADVGIRATPPAGDALYIYGKAENTGGWFVISDARRKTNVQTISNPLEKVLALRGVSFNWVNPDEFNSGPQIGFIAQEALNVLPEVVSTNGDYYSMQYAPVTALLVEAIKELKKENDKLKEKVNKIDTLQSQIDALKSLISASGSK